MCDVIELNNGKVKIRRTYLDNTYRSVMPERLFMQIEDDQGYVTCSQSAYQKLQRDLQIRQEKDRKLYLTAELNNKGISQEKSGDIEGAIQTYEQNLLVGNPAIHSYERLMILYRKSKDYKNEERVIRLALKNIKSAQYQEKYKMRLEKVKILKESEKKKFKANSKNANSSSKAKSISKEDSHYPQWY